MQLPPVYVIEESLSLLEGQPAEEAVITLEEWSNAGDTDIQVIQQYRDDTQGWFKKPVLGHVPKHCACTYPRTGFFNLNDTQCSILTSFSWEKSLDYVKVVAGHLGQGKEAGGF